MSSFIGSLSQSLTVQFIIIYHLPQFVNRFFVFYTFFRRLLQRRRENPAVGRESRPASGRAPFPLSRERRAPNGAFA